MMTSNKSILAFPDVKSLFDEVILTGRGKDLVFPDENSAVVWVHRANRFRVLDRKENEKLYETTHTLYGRSAYDIIHVARKDKTVRVKPITLDGVEVTDL